MSNGNASSSRKPRDVLVLEVVQVDRLGPHLIRVVLGGEDLEGFGVGAFTDHYVKLQLPPAGADYGPPFDPQDVKARLPKEAWPRTRTYTVRSFEPQRLELTIDFVVHGDTGVAGPWAAAARPGDRVQLFGPGGAYAPNPDADWHLMVGDLSVVPAIGASLERVPTGVPVFVVLEVEGSADEVALDTPGALEVTWLHGDGGDPELLARAVATLALPAGTGHAFVHGEASAVRAVRRHLLVDRGMSREALSCSGYWKRTLTEEGWRDGKAEWNRLVESDVA